MSSLPLEHRQRIVYAGLSRTSEDRGFIETAFQFWQKKMASRPFNVKEIVVAMERYVGLKGNEKKALHVSLQAATNKLEEQLKPVPAYLLDGAVAPTTSNDAPEPEQAHRSSQWQVITHIIDAQAKYLKRANAGAYDEFNNAIIEDGLNDVSKAISQSLATWADDNTAGLSLPDDISDEECRSLFHELYLLMSEVVGPVESDTIVNRSISSAINLDAAAGFDPRSLV